MTKKGILIISLMVIIPLMLSGCNLFKKNTNKEEIQQQEETFSGSIQDLIKKGKAAKCTYEGGDESQKFSGVVYISDKKARQDVTGEEDGEKIETHIIVDDRWTYMWTSKDPGKGMKMYIDTSEEEIKEFKEEAEEAYQEQDLEKEIDFKCSKWKVDQSKFTLPSDIDFTDMSAMMDEMKQTFNDDVEELDESQEMSETDIPENMPNANMDAIKKMMCDSCENSPNPSECRATFGCE
ncbi:hypothetical protein KKF32_01700 [Patescibacteria group bacterium]|nr:hypothetical protein [Patescibacteria group bacterium]